MVTDDKLLSAIDEARVLGYFKAFCEKNEEISAKQRLRNIFFSAQNKESAVKALFSNELGIKLSAKEGKRMNMLVEAFLKKSTFRRTITKEEKQFLLKRQQYQCVFCKKEIDLNSHTDHILPFKYVGDELEDNLQMLCEHCNKSKNARLDYEIRLLLHIL